MALHAAACVMVLALGFDHISDDDYARVTIAQGFAHAPRFDPSGTSWLPFPFWVTGSAMLVFGRSLVVARVVSIALASLAVALPYFALRSIGSRRASALGAVAFAILSPWSVWLGAATVPESFTASFTAAAAISLGSAEPAERARLPSWTRLAFAVGLLAACLSRYEPWPVAAMLAIVLAARAWRDRRAAPLLLAAIVGVGPLGWMVWNAHVHGDALHFLARVARFKRDLGESPPSSLEVLLLYPRLLVTARPDVIVALGWVALAWLSAFVPARTLRSRWAVPLACAGAQVAFLTYGNVMDGAPTHHPERALLGTFFVLALLAGDVVTDAWPAMLTRARSLALACAFALGVAWLWTSLSAFRVQPGTTPQEDRSPQIAAGNQLRQEGAEHLLLTPCAFEHFALIAAFGAPERVELRPRKNIPIDRTCPVVDRR